MVYRHKRFVCILASLLIAAMITACSGTTSSPPAQEPTAPSNESAAMPEGSSAPSEAAASFPTALAEIAVYEEADRQEQLVEAAKKEGEITIYTSTPMEDATKLAEKFTEKYGIKVNIWRGGSENVLQRVISEAAAGVSADVILNNAPELEAMHREKLLQKINSPHLKDIHPEAIPEHGEWIGAEFLVFVQAYNTNVVKPEEVPKTYEDLLDPKWKGRLAIEAEDINWFGTVVQDMGEEKGLDYFRQLKANGLSVRKGHSLLAELVTSGEVPLALTVFSYKAEQLVNEKAPFEWFVIEPALAVPLSVGVLKNTAKPNASVLFFDFMLSEGQQIFADMMHTVSNQTIENKAREMPLKRIDPALLIDDNGKWTELWDQIIVNGN